MSSRSASASARCHMVFCRWQRQYNLVIVFVVALHRRIINRL